jgi:hypothetical protein
VIELEGSFYDLIECGSLLKLVRPGKMDLN